MSSRTARNHLAERTRNTSSDQAITKQHEHEIPRHDNWFPIQYHIQKVLSREAYEEYEDCLRNIISGEANQITSGLSQMQRIVDFFPEISYSHTGVLFLLDENFKQKFGVGLPGAHLRSSALQLHNISTDTAGGSPVLDPKILHFPSTPSFVGKEMQSVRLLPTPFRRPAPIPVKPSSKPSPAHNQHHMQSTANHEIEVFTFDDEMFFREPVFAHQDRRFFAGKESS